MPSDKKKPAAPTPPTITTIDAPVIVTVAEKNALADETNPVLTTLPIKVVPQQISLTPPPAYTPTNGAPRGFVARLRSKFSRRPPRWNEDKVRFNLENF
jgi:hypothetical protein